ncbi:peptide/nickel transport system permease protein [Pseudoduganella namucuonensis]|uniref:Peptide/nickel transport system permease protein n=2 Tax=Pseudoduganella namucuonensis TaxID=1035707 RepID=A0A1I7F5L8_9BURK|nr:ABC transporter permease [Pseudoduganella namucuonensis]SFU31454.1 peptide/nickel transport system permease protein [Pseudoduganella namucuonensis]
MKAFWARAGAMRSRLLSTLVTLLGLLVLTFFVGRVMPIDPVLSIVGPDADASTYQEAAARLGLDQPLWVQFGRYLGELAQGNLGTSLLTGNAVSADIVRVFPATVELATLAIVLGVLAGVPLGVFAASRRGRLGDHVVRVISLAGHSTPVFWFAMMGLLVFYAWLGWAGGSGRIALAYDGTIPSVTGLLLIDTLLAGDWDAFTNSVKHIALPACILGLHSMAYISRMTRSFMLAQLSQEYILTARVKGLSEASVIWRHAFRNILVQLLTIVALAYGGLLEGAVLIETVFAWPGFGQYLTNSLLLGDMNSVMGCVLLVGVIFVSLNLVSDALYQVFDPRMH